MEKMTKKDYFNALAEIVRGAGVENETHACHIHIPFDA